MAIETCGIDPTSEDPADIARILVANYAIADEQASLAIQTASAANETLLTLIETLSRDVQPSRAEFDELRYAARTMRKAIVSQRATLRRARASTATLKEKLG